jgi:hypothetical protein
MIKRTYFVAYAGSGGLIGSVTFTSTSWFEKPDKVFVNAVDWLGKEHTKCGSKAIHQMRLPALLVASQSRLKAEFC